MKELFLLIFLIGQGLTTKILAQQDTLYLGFSEAVELSKEKNRNLQISQLEIEMAESGIREARGGLLPRLEAGANYNYNLLRPVIFLPPGSPFGEVLKLGADHSYSGTLSGNVPIYSGGVVTGIRMAQTNLQLTKEAEREARINAIGEVSRAYYTVLLSYQALQVMEASRDNAERLLKQLQLQFDEGVAAEYDVIRAEVQLQNIIPSVEQARNNYILSMDRLRLAIGIPPGQPIALTDSLVLDPVDEQLTPAIQDNPSVRTLRYQNTLAQQQINLAQAAKRPSLSAVGNYQVQAQANNFNFSEYNWVNSSVLGLQLRVPIFNGLITNQKIEQARIGAKQANVQQEMVKDAVQIEISNQLYLMNQSYCRYQAQQNSVKLAERGLSIANVRFNSGIGTLLELNDAELALMQARLNYLQAVYDYNIAYTEYQRLTGTIE